MLTPNNKNHEFLKSSYEVINAAKQSINVSGSTVSYSKVSGSAVKDVVASINKRIDTAVKEKQG